MATGVLGQADPTATTNTTIYTVPASKTATVNVSFCNRGTSDITVRLAVAATGTPSSSEYLEYDAVIPGGGVLERTGILAEATKNFVVYTSDATASVNIYGIEE